MKLALALSSVVLLGSATALRAEPFAQLRSAYLARDPAAAASAYAPDAQLVFRYAGTAEEKYRGSAAIAASYDRFFDQIDPASKLDLNFRIIRSVGSRRSGIYRLRIGKSSVTYGKFDVEIASDERFLSDLSSEATVADFEEAAVPVMLAADDEELEPAYYDSLMGRYRLSTTCDVIITRSVVRLFARNSCTNEWRGLNRIAGREWSAGDRVRSDKVVSTYRFAPLVEEASGWISINNGPRLQRRSLYRRVAVKFQSRDGTGLAGTLYQPNSKGKPVPAMVLIHGSGAQDRNGYASIMAVLADAMAAKGRAVLVYDKRGVGGSGGDWSRAGFATLAEDAIAGMTYLYTRRDIDRSRIGLGGSSQAGWVAAAALAAGAKPADVLLIGAAGTAMTVAEQNLYNSEVRMRCGRLSERDIAIALDQQRAFFAFLKEPARAPELDRLTVAGRLRPALTDWLFPDSAATDRSGGEWFTTLDPQFDPLPSWRRYRGRMTFLFAEHDDSTPSQLAIARLQGLSAKLRLIAGAQHIGLAADDRCRSDLDQVTGFSPAFFAELGRF